MNLLLLLPSLLPANPPEDDDNAQLIFSMSVRSSMSRMVEETRRIAIIGTTSDQTLRPGIWE